jgi:hypothetical protein
MRKSVMKKRATGKKRGRKPGRVAVHGKRKSAKKLTTAQKARAVTKALRERFSAFKAQAKQKLARVTATAHAKALADALRMHEAREAARKKVLAAAEAKFDKKFAKKLEKKAKKKSRRKGKTHRAHTAAMTHHTPTKKRRGRPRKHK